MTHRSLVVALITAAFALLVATSGAQAGVKEKKLRADLLELKARVAQLESQAMFLMRKGGPTAVTPSVGGLCSDPCTVDSDEDGIGDCEDPCPCDPNQADDDGDGMPDCADPCPGDATNACIDPCRQDADGDQLNDCEDPCPYDAATAIDGDSDGIMDCNDPCPNDRKNECFTPCPLDVDGDGTGDCVDPCPWGGLGMPHKPCILPPAWLEGGGVKMSFPLR